MYTIGIMYHSVWTINGLNFSKIIITKDYINLPGGFMTKLEKLLSVITKDHVFIQMHNYPDQDALASAYGLKVLLELNGICATICYKGEIEKHNTLKMLELLPIQIYHTNEVKTSSGDEIILVDGQKGNVNMQELVGEEIACIDHHPKQEVEGYKFYDIRSNVGSCSSIIAQYFIENNIEVTSDVATALIYGIKMDTASLTRMVSDLDLDMFYYLYKKADKDKLKIFDNSMLSIKDLDAYQNAISNLKIYGKIGIANIGADNAEAIIGSISDFIMELSEVECSLVYSYRVGGLKFSVRSEIKNIDAGNLIKDALKGYGDGGGHAAMAAGFIPNISSDAQAMQIAKIVEQRVIDFIQSNKA